MKNLQEKGKENFYTILNLLKSHPQQWFSAKRVAQVTGVHPASTRGHLHALVRNEMAAFTEKRVGSRGIRHYFKWRI